MADPSGARQHNRLGYIKLNEGKMEEALEEFTEAVKLDPENTSFRYTRITVLETLNRLEEAVQDYDVLLKQDPWNLEYYMGKATALEKQEHLNRAIDTMEKATEIHPRDPELYYEKSRFFSRYESYDRAINEIEKAIELNPEEPRYLHFLCELYQEVEEDKIAIFVYERLLGIDNCNPQYHYEKARILERTGKIEKAFQEMEIVGNMRPHSLSWSVALSEFYETHELYEKALEMRNRIVDLEPENWENYRDRANLKEVMGTDPEQDLKEADRLENEFRVKYKKA